MMKVLELTILVGLLAFAIGTEAAPAISADFGDPFFVWEPSYARAHEPLGSTKAHRIATYVPPTTLVFKDELRLGDKPLPGFTPVITQHGQRVLVLESTLSSRSFKDVYGRLNVIFHQEAFMCPADNKSCSEATGLFLQRGDVVLGTVETGGDFIKFVKTKNNGGDVRKQEGYLPTDTFEQWKAGGVATDVSQRYPRYLHHETLSLDSLATDCGEIKTSIDTTKLAAELTVSVEPTGLIPLLKDFFSIKAETSAEASNQTSLVVKYGGEDFATRYQKIVMLVPNENGDFTLDQRREFFASLELACVAIGRDRQEVYLSQLSFRENEELVWWRAFQDFYTGRGEASSSLNSDSSEFSVFRHNGNRPFLTSINSRKDYANAIGVWTDQVKDVSLATIFLGIFNATCPIQKEAGRVKREICNQVLPLSEKPRGG